MQRLLFSLSQSCTLSSPTNTSKKSHIVSYFNRNTEHVLNDVTALPDRNALCTTTLSWVTPQFASLLSWAAFARLAGLTVIFSHVPPVQSQHLVMGIHRLTIHGAGAMGSILQLLSRLLVLLVCVLSRMHAYVAAHHPTTNTISTPLQSILRRPATCRYKSIYSAW